MAAELVPHRRQHLVGKARLAARAESRRFAQFELLNKEAADLRRALEDRKIIERAKGILMKRASLDEEEAFRRLQRLSSEKNRKLIETAQMIITAEEAFFQSHKKPEGNERASR